MAERRASHRSENRVLRPFADSTFLEATELSLNPEVFPYDSNEIVDYAKVEEAGESLAPRIRIPPLPEDLAERVKCRLDDLALLIWSSDPNLKFHQASKSYKLTNWPREPVEIERSFVDKLSWAPGCMVGVSLILQRTVSANAQRGAAHRAGHWISQKVFRVSIEEVGTELPIRYVDDDKFVEHGFSPETDYAVCFEEGSTLLEPIEVGEGFPFVILFSNKIAARLRNPKAPIALFIAGQFNAYVVTEILRRGIDELGDDTPLEDSPLARFLRLASRRTGHSEPEIIDLVRNGKSDVVRSKMEAASSTRASLLAAMT